MAFRIQDLMMDVRPGGLQMANPECTCQVTVKPDVQRAPEEEPEGEPGPGRPGEGRGIPEDNPACQDTVLPSRDCPPDCVKTLAAELTLLRAQLRRDLGQST